MGFSQSLRAMYEEPEEIIALLEYFTEFIMIKWSSFL
jgi:hypothetical protein